jgi:hypothetical protein
VGGGASWYGPAWEINLLATSAINTIAAPATAIHVTFHILRRVIIAKLPPATHERIRSERGPAKRVRMKG